MAKSRKRPTRTEGDATSALTQREPSEDAARKQEAVDVGELLAQTDDLMLELKRRYAAYTRMLDCYDQVTGRPVPRRVGMPVFTFKASLNGVAMMDVVQDMNEVEVRFMPTVFGCFARAQAARMHLAAKRLHALAENILCNVSEACADIFGEAAPTAEGGGEQPAKRGSTETPAFRGDGEDHDDDGGDEV